VASQYAGTVEDVAWAPAGAVVVVVGVVVGAVAAGVGDVGDGVAAATMLAGVATATEAKAIRATRPSA
jgi:hypothetical protein